MAKTAKMRYIEDPVDGSLTFIVDELPRGSQEALRKKMEYIVHRHSALVDALLSDNLDPTDFDLNTARRTSPIKPAKKAAKKKRSR